MGLEVATYIDGLVITNPVGATDPKSQGDDHIRLLKSTIKASFPNITGAMTATHTQLNLLATDGAGAGVVADLAAFVDPNADRIFGWDDSANAAIGFALGGALTTSGTTLTVPDAIGVIADLGALADPNADVFYGWDDSASALIGFTLVSGELLTTGTTFGVGSNIPKKDAANTFTAAASASTPPIRIGTSSDSFSIGASTLLGIAAAGAATLAIRDETNNIEGFLIAGTSNVQFGTVTAHALALYTNNTQQVSVATTGAITTNNTSAAEFGYKGMPKITQTADYTLALTDAGTFQWLQKNGAQAITIPSEDTVNFPLGTVIMLVNQNAGSANDTIAIASGTLFLAGTGFATSGTRTLAYGGIATLVKTHGNTGTASQAQWMVSGPGVS